MEGTTWKEIDCSAISLNESFDAEDAPLKQIGDDIFASLEKWGFAVLTNTGLRQKMKESKAWETVDAFLELPEDIKEKVNAHYPESLNGYVGLEKERIAGLIDPESTRPNDLKLMITYNPNDGMVYPKEAPGIHDMLKDVWMGFGEVSVRLCDCLGIAFKGERSFFTERSKGVRQIADNHSNLRFALYPPTKDKDVKDKQMRCGEHIDYGVLSLICQDENGGIEILCPDGVWREGPTSENSVLLISDDVMPMWTNKDIKPVLHRVGIAAADDIRQTKERRSTIFFLHPDDDSLLPTKDGSITWMEHVAKLLKQLYP